MENEELSVSRSCRICSLELTVENSVWVFGDEGKKLFLQAKIRKYLYITVSLDDRLPKIICDCCCKKLEDVHKFATMALKIQDKLNKLVIDLDEPQSKEKRGLLHSYLTKDVVEKENEHVTEMEVKVDPMLILQYDLEDDDSVDSDLKCDVSNKEASYNNPSQNTRSNKNSSCKNKFPSRFCHKIYPSTISSEQLIEDESSIQKLRENYLVECSFDSNESETYTPKNNKDDNICFACPICGKLISTKGNLKVHLETHRPKGKYGCEICGRIFKTQCNLFRHKEYHKGVQFACEVCGRVYPTNSTLRAHSITHSDLRPHKCPLCVKTFKRNQDLKFHINQHTGARPYRCPYCPKAFASSGNCFSHRKRMHPLEVERDREKAATIMR